MHPILAGFLGCLATFASTCIGAALVAVFGSRIAHHGSLQYVLAVAVGFMVSAILHVFEEVKESSTAHFSPEFAWVPLAVGVFMAIILFGVIMKVATHFGGEHDHSHHHGHGHEHIHHQIASSSVSRVDVDQNQLKDPEVPTPVAVCLPGYDEAAEHANDVPEIMQSPILVAPAQPGSSAHLMPASYHICDPPTPVSSLAPPPSPAIATTGLLQRGQGLRIGMPTEVDGSPADIEEKKLPTSFLTPEEQEYQIGLRGKDGALKVKLVLFALSLHHIPEALAIGVTCGLAAKDPDMVRQALALTLALCLQHIPEGTAAAVIALRSGQTPVRSFIWGSLTSVIQPLAGIIGAASVVFVEAVEPYLIAFAGAAMLFIVVKEMIPECYNGHQKTFMVTVCIMLGFLALTIFETVIGETVGGGHGHGHSHGGSSHDDHDHSASQHSHSHSHSLEEALSQSIDDLLSHSSHSHTHSSHDHSHSSHSHSHSSHDHSSSHSSHSMSHSH